MIIALKQHLSTCGQASLLGLSRQFDVDPNHMRDLLRCWQNKGCVRQIPKAKACGSSCGKCQQACGVVVDEYFEWVAA